MTHKFARVKHLGNHYTQYYRTSCQIYDIRDTDPDTENTDHVSDMSFYGPLVSQSE